MFLRKSLDFSIHNVCFQVSVKIAVLFWNRCMMSTLLGFVQLQSWIPYVQTGYPKTLTI
jgi:hypothetical protein